MEQNDGFGGVMDGMINRHMQNTAYILLTNIVNYNNRRTGSQVKVLKLSS